MWCPKTFVDNSNMRDHKRKMHKKELKEYEAIHPTGKDITLFYSYLTEILNKYLEHKVK